ncbi:hypothetical protein KIN20_032459 [Parelaphostrongylus tenuis]|uniref:Uncharacterized protein n=1 Tax=Parelaphostrongylus tenuis TaxID=148309 RepID=A0AAD5WIH9_PARTN|nr:hypothetical protein KIN20_032459 [Parelaphostrongylus tenuis]
MTKIRSARRISPRNDMKAESPKVLLRRRSDSNGTKTKHRLTTATNDCEASS